MGAVHDTDPKPLDVRLGDASRRRHHGGAGSQRRLADAETGSRLAPVRNDVVVIGGGHNGLIAAAFLAKAGLKTLVLERIDRVGGGVRMSEIAPGFRCPTLAHTAAVDPAIVRTLALERHGLEILQPDAYACAPTVDGRVLTLWRDPTRALQELSAFSSRDS